MNYRSDKAKLAHLAALVLERRAAVIRAGGEDPAMDEITETVKSRFDGDVNGAAKSLLDELAQRVQNARDASHAARERDHQARNSPVIKEMWMRREALLAEAEGLQSRARTIEAGHKAKVDALKAQGFSADEIASVLKLSETGNAEELKQRHSELLAEAANILAAIEVEVARVLAEGSAP